MKNAIVRKMPNGTFTASIYNENGDCIAEHSDFTTEARAAEYCDRYTETAEETTETETEEQEETPATPGEMLKVRNVIMGRGGYRERELLKAPHTMTHGETWDDAHKVVYVLSASADPDGHRDGCAVDIVTRAIVG